MRFGAGRKGWIFWLAGLGVVVAAIVLNFSRAGIGLLVVGCVLWLAVLVLRSGSTARIAIGASALLALLTSLLLFGGQTLERFNLRGTGSTISTDFRWLIFKDAFELIRSSPWRGIGAGKFRTGLRHFPQCLARPDARAASGERLALALGGDGLGERGAGPRRASSCWRGGRFRSSKGLTNGSGSRP